MAVSETNCPALYQGPRGLFVTVPAPDGVTAVSSSYCVAKLAVLVVSKAGTVMEWLWAPPSLQEVKRERLWPSAETCGLGALKLCEEPAAQSNVTGAV